MVCLKCGFVNDPDADFCENCGSPMAHTCNACGVPLKPQAHFCKKCGALVPARGRGDRLAALQTLAPQDLRQKERSALRQAEGERKTATILFTDIVGSTALAEKLDPEEWKEIVSGAHRIVSQAVYRYEGTIAQLLGDGVLAFFGAPITHEDDPLRAVRAAVDIQRAMMDYWMSGPFKFADISELTFKDGGATLYVKGCDICQGNEQLRNGGGKGYCPISQLVKSAMGKGLKKSVELKGSEKPGPVGECFLHYKID